MQEFKGNERLCCISMTTNVRGFEDYRQAAKLLFMRCICI